MLLVAFGIKAAVFPLSTWLPDSYPTAPAPVTAVFAGLLTKVGVYAIIRAHSLLFPSGGLDPMLLVAALLTMLVGILGAIAQSDIKRLLSFTLVSHIGYMVFGIALSSQLGMSGAIYYVAHHIVVQTTLFLVVGLIERQAGASTLQRLGGLAAASPMLAFVFVVPALNLGGIPPFSGFIGKVALLEAGAQNGSVLAWLLVGGGVLTSLLTLYVVARVWTKAFWRSREDAPEGHLSAGGAGRAARRTEGSMDIAVRRPRRRGPDAGRHAAADGRADRGGPDADGARRADLRLQRAGRRRRCSTAASTSPPCWGAQNETGGAAGLGAVLADAGVDFVVGHGFCGQRPVRPGRRVDRSHCCCRCRRCPIEGKVHPLSLLRLIVTVAYYLVLSSVQVAWLAVKPGPPPLSAVLRAHLAVKSDLVLALAVQHLQPDPRFDRAGDRPVPPHALRARDRRRHRPRRGAVLPPGRRGRAAVGRDVRARSRLAARREGGERMTSSEKRRRIAHDIPSGSSPRSC